MRGFPVWARLCLILGGLAMLLSATAVVLPRVLVNWAVSDIRLENLLSGVGGDTIDGAINVLLLGMDERGRKLDRADPHRLNDHRAHPGHSRPRVPHLAAARQRGGHPGLPRGGLQGTAHEAQRRPSPSATSQRRSRTTRRAAGRRGVQLTAMTINDLVPGGLRFNAVAIINFVGFRQDPRGAGRREPVRRRAHPLDPLRPERQVPHQDREREPAARCTRSAAATWPPGRHWTSPGSATRAGRGLRPPAPPAAAAHGDLRQARQPGHARPTRPS